MQETFALPPENKIIESWPADVDKSKFTAIQTEAEKKRKEPETYYCIIPLFGTAKAEVVLPAWPRISQIRFDTLQTRIAERFDVVVPRLLAQNVTGPLYYLLLLAVRPFPWPFGLIRDKALNFVKASMLADLVRRDMIESWELPPNPDLDCDDIRLVLAELINPSYDLRNVAGLAKAAGLDCKTVQAVLDLGQKPAASGKNFQVWRAPWTDKEADKDRGVLYTLMGRKPGRFTRFLWCFGRLVVSVLGRERSPAWLSKPAVDKRGV